MMDLLTHQRKMLLKYPLLMMEEQCLLVKIENNSATASIATPFAPGVWAVHSDQVKLFTSGSAASADRLKN